MDFGEFLPIHFGAHCALGPNPGNTKKTTQPFDLGEIKIPQFRAKRVRREEKCYPVCLTGKRVCPPEDCGGIWGYTGFLEALHDPQHPEHEEMLEWVGGEFDSEAFDLNEINREL
jgi:hypothetical protein